MGRFMYRENYQAATGTQIAIAGLGCIIGGIAVTALGFCGAFGGYESLEKMGFSLQTIPFYAFVTLCGIGIIMRIPYAATAALVSCAIEIALYLGMGVMGTSSIDMSFFVMLKLAVALCCTQLLVAIRTNDLEDESGNDARMLPQACQPQHQAQGNINQMAARQGCGVARNNMPQGNGVPQPRRTLSQAPSLPQPRGGRPAAQPPQPRR